MPSFIVRAASGQVPIEELDITLTEVPLQLVGLFSLPDLLSAESLLAGIDSGDVVVDEAIGTGWGVFQSSPAAIAFIEPAPVNDGGPIATATISSQTIRVAANEEAVFDRVPDITHVIGVYYRVYTTGDVIPAVGTVDPTSVSTGDALLINGNLSDLVYNNSSIGSANKPLPGINLGQAYEISRVDVYWWNSAYRATTFRIQGSQNGVDWVDLTKDLTGVFTAAGIPQTVDITGTYQYVRVFSVTGANSSFIVLSELQVRGPSPTSDVTLVRAPTTAYELTGVLGQPGATIRNLRAEAEWTVVFLN